MMGEELWYVKLANGDVHRVTIDQLDGAFQAGHIDESTMVLAAGASQWTKLGDIAGLDDESAPDSQPGAEQAAGHEDEGQQDEEPAYVPQVHASASPESEQDAEADYVPQQPAPAYVQQTAEADYVPQRPAPAYVQQAAADYVPQRPPPAYVQQAAAPVAQVQTAGYIPQIAQRTVAAAPVSYAPPAQGTPYSVSISTKPPAAVPAYVPNSLRPMSMDLGELDDMPFQRKSKTGRFVAAVVGLAAIAGGVGFAAQNGHFKLNFGSSSSDLSNVAAAAAIAAPPPPPVAEPVAAPPPAPAPPPAAASPSPAGAAPTEASPMNPQFTTRLNEDTTKKLLANDKAHEAKAKARHSGGGGGSSSSSHGKSTTFTTGGSKFDPLNSSI
ncbi:MAG TPA: GYF domain-containing protein [Polyangiaceae bacterium]|nr:GYF domain-containing protein [Polyangiaceae bacterium]